jgi:hypothetical protein
VPRGVESLKLHHIFRHFRDDLGVGMVYDTEAEEGLFRVYQP